MLAFTTTPKPAKHGKALIAGLAVNESDTAGPVQVGTVACTATIATKHVTTQAHGLKNGIAVCSWQLPKTSKGKTIRGTITVTVQGVTGRAQLQREDHLGSSGERAGARPARSSASGRACRRGRR